MKSCFDCYHDRVCWLKEEALALLSKAQTMGTLKRSIAHEEYLATFSKNCVHFDREKE